MHSITSKPNFRISVVGDGAVGKTWLLSIFAGIQTWIPTACEDRTCHVTLDGLPIDITLCDTAGQEYYDKLRILTYLQSDVILLCFSIDNRVSFRNIEDKWICEVKQYYPTTPIILVGCKADLRQDQKLQWPDPSGSSVTLVDRDYITYEEGMALAQKIDAKRYCECSAKTGEGIDEVFEYAAREALNARARAAQWTSTYKCIVL